MPFSIRPGHCSFFSTDPERAGQPTHCPGEVVARGDYIDALGKRHHDAEACAEHADELAPPRFRIKSPR